MRKDRFVKAFAEHLPNLRKVVELNGLSHDDTSEVLGRCSLSILKNKNYRKIEPGKLKAFLRTHVQFEILHYKTSLAQDSEFITRLPDVDDDSVNQNTVIVSEVRDCEHIGVTECPFCFRATLNEHGACHMCHTIIPSDVRLQRKSISYNEKSLSVEFDFNTAIDVQKAIERLTAFEQKVVKAIGLGNETLDSFALDLQRDRNHIFRIWVTAKAKLQEYLSEYAPKHLSKRGQSAFKKALQRVEKQQENRV